MRVGKAAVRFMLALSCFGVFASGILLAQAQDSGGQNPHLSHPLVAPAGVDEVSFCMKCHTSGCTLPHPERAPVNWQINGKAALASGGVTCGSCHSPGFRNRSDAFLARDQNGLCTDCHYGQHELPNAHPFATPCASCHTASKQTLSAQNPATQNMVVGMNSECLRCHYDGPISHPVGMKNSKKPATDLPLGSDGTITCITCHFGHDRQTTNPYLLRKNNKHGALCLSCHDDL